MNKKNFFKVIKDDLNKKSYNGVVSYTFLDSYFEEIKNNSYKKIAIISLDKNIINEFRSKFSEIEFIDTESFLSSFKRVDLSIVTDFFSKLDDKTCIKFSKLLSRVSPTCIFGMNVSGKLVSKTIRPRQVIKLSYMIEDYWAINSLKYTDKAVFAKAFARSPRIMIFPKNDNHFNKQKDRYQYHVLCMALEHLRGRKTAVDIGGHIGFYSLAMAEIFDKVISFEAYRPNYKCLIRNVHGLPNIETANIALSDKDEYLRPIVDHKNSGNIQMKPGGEIPAKPLDFFNLNNVDLIKIDVQGFEEKVLKGAMQTIVRNKPILIVELQVDDSSGINKKALRFLNEKLKYKLLVRYGKDFIMGPA